MAICPFATFVPTSFGGRVPRKKGQRGILHVAVSEKLVLAPWDANTWTFYVNKLGGITQFVDTDFCAWANMDANGDAIAIETQGGVTDPEHELWTPAQAAAIARIIRWVHDTEGTPIELLPDSKPGRRGWGPHRLGIDPWRVPGGEVWSSSRGKICPGSGKIGQIPGILQMAVGEGDDPVKNLIIANDKNNGVTWVGDGITRRRVANPTDLADLRYWVGKKGGDATVYDFDNIRVLGVAVQDDYTYIRDQVAGWVGADPEKTAGSRVLDAANKTLGL